MGLFGFIADSFADGLEDTFDKVAKKTDRADIYLEAMENKERLQNFRNRRSNHQDEDDDY